MRTTQMMRQPLPLIVLAVVVVFSVPAAVSAIPTAVVGGEVGSSEGLDPDVCYSFSAGEIFGDGDCSITGLAREPVQGATTMTVPLGERHSEGYGYMTFQHDPLCEPSECLTNSGRVPASWEASVPFRMEGLVFPIPGREEPLFEMRLVGRGILHGVGCADCESGSTWRYSYTFAPMSEPSTIGLLGSALVGLGVLARAIRRKG